MMYKAGSWVKLREWGSLPKEMQHPEVRTYYDILQAKRGQLYIKRIFDIVFSAFLLVLVAPVMLILAVWIKADSKGPVFYRQERVTQYGRTFRIFKFRTMVQNADKIGAAITSAEDVRVTNAGAFLRKCRLDELPQLFNVLTGDMTIVGTRPEVRKYVNGYTTEMLATLLLPAGVTSLASIKYKDESELLGNTKDIDKTYLEDVLPGKMKYNLDAIREFSFLKEIGLMLQTIIEVLR